MRCPAVFVALAVALAVVQGVVLGVVQGVVLGVVLGGMVAPAPARAGEAVLLFASGFEGGVRIAPPGEDYQPITGRDSQTGFRWPISILGARGSALHPIDHDGHRAVFARLVRTIGHDGRPTRALFQAMDHAPAACCTQMPYEILNIRQGRHELYVRFWIRLDAASLHRPDSWRSFFEWKSRGYARGAGFRLISFVYTDAAGNPYWHFQGDRDPDHPLWEVDNTRIPVPQDRWFLNEFYWHWSSGNRGRALWRVNGRVVADHVGVLTRNRQPVDFIMLAQIYGDGAPMRQYFDDLEIWSGWPVARAGPLPPRR